uniref:hypothetical protein n=2 Tax=Candidatus Fimivicinus sp. TaxID=3056640 RepID=UPI003FEE0F3B
SAVCAGIQPDYGVLPAGKAHHGGDEMKRFVWNAAQSGRILRRHRMLALFLILQCALCLGMAGTVANQAVQSGRKIEDFQTRIGGKRYYTVSESMSETDFYRFLHEENLYYPELVHFVQEMMAEKQFSYIVAMGQPITIIDYSMPRELIYGYEEGQVDNFVQKDEKGRLYTTVNSYQVSEPFFSEFQLRAQEGRLLEGADFADVKAETLPVVAGSGYRADFSLGDTLKCNYLGREFTLQIVGFLEKDASFSRGGMPEYCDRYLLLPQLNPQQNKPTEFNKWRLSQQASGFIVTDQSFEAVQAIVSAHLQAAGLPDFIHLNDPTATSSELADLSAMTQEVSDQFNALLMILTVFVILCISITVNGFIREKHYEYGVFLLNGARWSDLVWDVAAVVGAVVLGGDILATLCLWLSHQSWQAILYMQGLALLIGAAACVVPLSHVHRMDISDLIGGKE